MWGPETKNFFKLLCNQKNLNVKKTGKHGTVLWERVNRARAHEMFTKSIPMYMNVFHNSAIPLINSWKTCTCSPGDIDEEVY